jgi:hypothetical protein
MTPPPFKNPGFIDWVIVPLVLLSIVLLGHYGLFFGHTFFVEEDPVTSLSYATRDKFFSGWRPDLGAGLTFFFGDPGLFHTWSLFHFWQTLFSNPVWAYNVSTLILLWLACVVVYFFLRETVPGLNKVLTTVLAGLIVFGSLRHEFFFQRHWILLTISSGLISLILYDFFKSPSPKHFFLYALTLFAALFLGHSRILAVVILFAVTFFFLHVYYHGLQKNPSDLWIRCKQFFLLNLGSGIGILFLGAWVFYSVFHEMFLTGYVRDANDLSGTFFAPHGPLFYLNRFLSAWHAGLFSPYSGVLGISQNMSISGWNNVSPLFPLVLVVLLFQKSQSFWEFCAKFMVVGIFLVQELLDGIPGIMWLLPKALNIFGDFKVQPVTQIYEVVLVGIFIQRLQDSNFLRKPLEIKLVRCLAAGLSLLYGFLLLLASGSKLMPEKFNLFLQEIFQWLAHRGEIGVEKEGFGRALISNNIQLFHETTGWCNIIFYGIAFLFVLSFSSKKFPDWFARSKGLYFSIFLLITNLFLSWAIYPLNKEPLIWDRQNFTKSSTQIIKEYDRIARVGAVESCLNPKNFIDCIKFKYLEGEFGPKRYNVGYRMTPGLDFSGLKSFSQKEVALLVNKFLERDGLSSMGSFRYLQGFPPFFPYKIYDFTGVKYFVSQYPLPTSKNIKLIHSSFQFYLYQNMNAWPYYYFADRIEAISDVEELYSAEQGVAYLWKGDNKSGFSGKKSKGEGLIELKRFRFGEVNFSSLSDDEEFLVVADAWHPYWRAQVDGEEVAVIKTNGIFKGVLVPPGNHEIRLFFDNTAYRPGIWISILSWIVFIGAWARSPLKYSNEMR